ncbi:tRNA methyltransferase 10 homolog B isoform X2 [Crotalus tigris]|uniref:tRNA methyltransferase 10 homolog B isoform X2 n=1 Tax=Crotalus tigris TaxID=88082 RepID=UPI00192FA8D7|nr:tRNA methyltransferase 10 homolog B isoform X2 [Crotalus tigris]
MTNPEKKVEKSICGDHFDQQQNYGDGDEENFWGTFELLEIDGNDERSSEQVTGNENWCSRNVLRKQRHWEKIVSAKKDKRKCERERRKAKHAEQKGTAPQLSKRDLKAIAKDRLLEAKATGPQLCIDMSLTSHMTNKEISRLAAQIRRLYGSNKKAQKPFWLHLTGIVKNSPIYEACLRMNDGFANYLMDVTAESYLDLFPLDMIVYLTPDSDNVLEEVDLQKVHILGGLVDESIQKERHLQTARLPIQEYMVKNVNAKNYHSTTLAINQVFDALSTFCDTKNWEEALKVAVSPGKGYIFKDTK